MRRLSEISSKIINLSAYPSITVIQKLKETDLVLFEDRRYNIAIPPRKAKGRKGVWVTGIQEIGGGDGDRRLVEIRQDAKLEMTNHEKKVMIRNIKTLSEKRSEEDILRFIPRYFENLSNHNSYNDKDVRECMSYFPNHLLKKSGVVL